MLVVLGFDGLDPVKVDEFNCSRIQQDFYSELQVPGEIPLHTEVIWPSIITGCPPEQHGLTRTMARKWENPLLQITATLANALIPRKILLPVGKKIIKLGFGRTNRGNPDYYKDRGLETMFSNTRSKVVGVPGYNPSPVTDELRELGGHSTHAPQEEIEVVIDRLKGELNQRKKDVFDSLDLPVNLLMVYSYSTDMVGHLFWDDKNFLKEWYEKCDELVGEIKNKLSPGDELIVLSDHGMKQGKHRRKSFFSYSSPPPFTPEDILDVKPFVDQVLSDSKQGHEQVQERLENLGYI